MNVYGFNPPSSDSDARRIKKRHLISCLLAVAKYTRTDITIIPLVTSHPHNTPPSQRQSQPDPSPRSHTSMKIKAKVKITRQRHIHRNSRNPTARIPTIPHPLDLLRLPTQPQHRNRGNLAGSLKPIAARHLKHPAVKIKTHHRRRSLHDTNTIIKIQLPCRLLVQSDSNDDGEILSAHFRRRHPGRDALGVDDAAAVVQRDVCDGEVREGHVGAVATDGREGPEVVEDVVGHVHVDACSVLFRHGADEDAGAVEVLQVKAEGVGVIGVDVEHGVHEGSPVHGLLVEGGVDVVEEPVAHVDDFARCGCHGWPSVELLRDGWRVGVVVSVEGTEGSQHGPASTQLLVRVFSIATDI